MQRAFQRRDMHNGFATRDSWYFLALVVGGTFLQGFYSFRIVNAFSRETPGSQCNRRRCFPLLRDSLDQDRCLEPWVEAVVDYSGANEYYEAHYGMHPSLQLSPDVTSLVPYFCREKSAVDQFLEPIYNARELGAVQESEVTLTTTNLSNSTPMEIKQSQHIKLLEKYGMTLIHAPTRVIDWKNRTQIKDVYIQELETILPSLFTSEISMYTFWNPMLRGENHELSPHKDRNRTVNFDDLDQQDSISTANVASMVHIDTDVGAYDDLDEFLAIVETNQVRRQQGEDGDRDESKKFDRNQYRAEIVDNRKRFAVVNFWRSTNKLEPVTSSPLAILSTRYEQGSNNIPLEVDADAGANSTVGKTNKASCDKILAFPNLRPDLEQSKWYTFPNMTNDEVLVFYQYDRLATQPSDLWHCAISIKDHDPAEDPTLASKWGEKAPRESFDIRALIVFEDSVDEQKDRFPPDRVRPVLSFEESGCFCDKQAEERSR